MISAPAVNPRSKFFWRRMDSGSDASTTEALIQATLMAERAWENATLFGGWQSTLDDVVVKPSLHGADREKDGWSSRRRDNST